MMYRLKKKSLLRVQDNRSRGRESKERGIEFVDAVEFEGPLYIPSCTSYFGRDTCLDDCVQGEIDSCIPTTH